MELARDMMTLVFRHRQRAEKVNEGENERLRMFTQLINKYQNNQVQRSNRAIDNLRSRLTEINAYRRVLDKHPLKNAPEEAAPTNQFIDGACSRYQFDMKTFANSFSRPLLRPEIEKALAEMNPQVRKKMARERLLRVARHRSNYLIDRRITNAAMNRERGRHKQNV